MGEWAVTLEANTIRPGRVTFVIHNGGTRSHGFRIRSDNGGSGGERFEKRTPLIQPGSDGELTVDLSSGTYEVDCYVEEPGVGEHDELGMETTLTVREDAPPVAVEPEPTSPQPLVSIEGFAFSPEVLEVTAGAEVVWTNNDPARHTVTAEDRSFDSGLMDSGISFSQVISAPGTYRYLCTVHPTMRGQIVVRP